MNNFNSILNSSCPTLYSDQKIISMAHGGGGRATQDLIKEIFFSHLGNKFLCEAHDGSLVGKIDGEVVLTTDSHVISPLFFPGGDIGKLAVCGTLNDIAMCGAEPLYLTASFIIEEGFSIESLKKIVDSMSIECKNNDVFIVAGDTKVVEKGLADGIYINTSGIGKVIKKFTSPSILKNYNGHCSVLLSNDIGKHGLTIMSKREGFEFGMDVESDCRSVVSCVRSLLKEDIDILCLRDLTRGGLATALIEISQQSGCKIVLNESAIIVEDVVKTGCELFGFDPLYVANEGCFITILPKTQEFNALEVLGKYNKNCSIIGDVYFDSRTSLVKGEVQLVNEYGTSRRLSLLSGEQLPRIC